MNLKRLEKDEEAFNERYGVNFSIEAFDEKVSAFDKFTGGVDIDEMYRTVFSELHKKAFANFVDARLGKNFDYVIMLKEFDNEIMNPYSKERKVANKPAPSAMGGWMASKYLESVYDSLDNVPNSKIDFATKRYRDGDLKIRDMKNLANKLENEANPSSEELATLYCYAEALSNVNNERSTLSMTTNLVKYFAEKREAKNFKSIVAKATEGKTIDKNGTKKIDEVLAYVNDDIILQSKKAIKQGSEKTALAEEVKVINNNLKQQFAVKELDNVSYAKTSERIQEASSVSKELNVKQN